MIIEIAIGVMIGVLGADIVRYVFSKRNMIILSLPMYWGDKRLVLKVDEIMKSKTHPGLWRWRVKYDLDRNL
jgi:hypothetical protein